MNTWKVPLAAVRVTDEDVASVVDVYRSGWLTMGSRTEEFEDALREYAGVDHCLAVSSCTAALHLIARAAGIGPGDQVIVPSMTFVATANAVAYTGADPVFAEIAAIDRPWLSAEAAEAAISERTKAILTVSYGGHPGEIEALRDLAERRGLVLLEDNAHGLGSWAGGRHLGSFGLAGALSFSAGKNLGVGEGGAILSDDAALADRVRRMRWHGITVSTWDRHRALVGSYGVDELGFNYRIDDPRSALAASRLERLDEDNRSRAWIDSFYRSELSGFEELVPTVAPPDDERSSHCMFTVVLAEQVDRDGFRRSLAEQGVQTSVSFPPVHRFPLYADSGARLPLTDAYSRSTVSLPIFPGMEDWQQELVVEAIGRTLRPKSRQAAARAR